MYNRKHKSDLILFLLQVSHSSHTSTKLMLARKFNFAINNSTNTHFHPQQLKTSTTLLFFQYQTTNRHQFNIRANFYLYSRRLEQYKIPRHDKQLHFPQPCAPVNALDLLIQNKRRYKAKY